MIRKFRSGEVSVRGIPISLFFFGIYNLHGICQSTRKNHAKVEIHDFHRTQGQNLRFLCLSRVTMYKERKIGGYIRWKTASTQLQSLYLYFCLPHFLAFNVLQLDFFFLEFLFLLEKSAASIFVFFNP